MQIAATHLASGAGRLKLTYANLMEPLRAYCPKSGERTCTSVHVRILAVQFQRGTTAAVSEGGGGGETKKD